MKHRSLKITALLLSLVFVFLSFPNAFSFGASASNADTGTSIVDKKVISIVSFKLLVQIHLLMTDTLKFTI